jgi:tRNA pseudouridine55 synthase
MASGGFRVEDALPFDRLDAVREGEVAPLRPVEAGLSGLPCLRAGASDAGRLAHGQAIAVGCFRVGDGELGWVSHDGRPVAIVERRGALLHPVRVFVFGAGDPEAEAPAG